MDFGKLPSVDNVDFTMPPEPAPNADVLSMLVTPERAGLYLGATGYNMKPWVGHWYPFGAKDKDFLRCYGTQFNTIEHNTTHYRIPDMATVARWREEVPADFRYCPKIPQTISHARDLGLSSGLISLFCEVIAELEEQMGCCFLQLPPQFSTQDLPMLERFLDTFDSRVPLAVEVRHPSFFLPTVAAEMFYQLLQERNIATVITDVAGRRDVCHMRLTNRQVLIRFVGNALHPTDYERIRAWSERLKHWFGSGLHAAYFFTHEPDNLLAPDLAAFCAGVFAEKMPGIALRGPKPVAGQQGTLF
ncbi:MAG: DUF72 domain-containing protein [Saprospiraceae bacterium]|nr:DUF72 domain-containing protein [Saprospiraceae bacterium]